MAGTILYLDDAPALPEGSERELQRLGFRLASTQSLEEALRLAREGVPRLILLEVLMPAGEGWQLLEELRSWPESTGRVPVVVLTRGERSPELYGRALELGADDYICKPFSPREVVARVKAIFRRLHAEPQTPTLVSGSISLDDETHQVLIDKQVLNLTPNEFGLLKIMMSQPNRVFSRNELINHVQGYDFEGYDRTIDTHIKNLRKKIAQKLPGQEIIRTVYGVGYKFSAEPD